MGSSTRQLQPFQAPMATLDQAFAVLRTATAGSSASAGVEGADPAPFERVAAVLLTRAAGRKKGNAALEALESSRLLSPRALAEADLFEIVDALKERGVSVQASVLAPLRNFARWVIRRGQIRFDMRDNAWRSTESLREELAAIKGIGCADADAILLYALKRPSYAVDRPTFRVLARHGWVDPGATYEEVRDLLVDRALNHTRACGALDADAAALAAAEALLDLAAGMEQIGRRFCTAASPRCEGCPLESLLPEGGPRTFDD
jgi:endonuclease III-like uncharacterized protein